MNLFFDILGVKQAITDTKERGMETQHTQYLLYFRKVILLLIISSNVGSISCWNKPKPLSDRTNLFAVTKNPILCQYAPKTFEDQTQTEAAQPEHWITVFVHGIKSIRPHVSFDNFFRFMGDNVEGTVYSKTVELMRTDPHFYQNQAMQQVGLHPIDQHAEAQAGNAPRAMGRLFDEINKLIGKNEVNHYYTYGWSGLLSPTMRYKDSIPFLAALEQEYQAYQKQGITPKIRLIGYSHGGNVCLNIARAYHEVFPNCPFKVNELLLVGSPIQGETDYLINSPFFEAVYNFYSHGDRIQKLDFFSYDRFFSGQLFTERKDFKLPSKLHQIQLKVMRNSHRTNRCPRKQSLANNIHNTAVFTGNTHLIRDASPGHSELWFFGWTPVSYRHYFPLHPMPAISLAPLIIQEINTNKDLLPSPNPIVADIRPHNGVVIIRSKNALTPIKTSYAINHDQFKELKTILQPYKPHNYTPQKYDDHIMLAYEHARVYHAFKHQKRNPIAAKNQAKLQRDKQLQREEQTTKKIKKQDVSMNISLHQKWDCPYCKKTYQTVACIYRIESQSVRSSSIESCWARKASIESGILFS